MKTSDSIDKLAPALVAAQAEMPIVERDGSAEVERDNGGGSATQYQYTSLGSMLQTVRPILSKHGLAVIQGGDGEHVDGHVCMETTIIHESGQYLCGTMRIPFTQGKNAAQSAGAAITYCRRYAFSSMLGVTSEEDTDAGKPVASKVAPPPVVKAQPARPAKSPEKPKSPVTEKAEPEDPTATSESFRMRAMTKIAAAKQRIKSDPSNAPEAYGLIRLMIPYAEQLRKSGTLTEEHYVNLVDAAEEVLNEGA
jgi:hypothetical protein